jgi:hypothetical protein
MTTDEQLGIFHNLPFSAYAEDPGVNHSSLKLIDRSPLDFQLKRTTDDDEDTSDLAFGRAYHHLLLEPKTFPQAFLLSKKIRRVGGEWERLQLQAQAENKQILWDEEYQQILDMRKVLGSHSLVPGIFDNAEREVTVYWKENDHRFKARIDIVNKSLGLIADLKTTRSSHPFDFPKSVFEYGYDTQAAWYVRAMQKMDVKIENFVIIAQSKEAPYHVMVYNLNAETLGWGTLENEARLKKYFACSQANQWPGYEEVPYEIKTPEWKINRLKAL